MLRSAAIAIILSAACVGLIACSEEPGPLAVPDEATTANHDKATIKPLDDLLPILKRDLLIDLECMAGKAKYDVLSFTVDVAEGGTLLATPDSWSLAGYDGVFGLDIAPNSWDPQRFGEVLRIEIRVPRMDTEFPCEWSPMFFELHAVGYDRMLFSSPVGLTFSFHPNLDPWCEELYLFHYDTRLDGSLAVLEVARIDSRGAGSPRDASCGYALKQEINHFSRWGVTNGTSGGGDYDCLPD